jgi:tuftelin-interacting protein 11
MTSMNPFARGSSSESSSDEDDFLRPSTDPQADEFADYNPRKRRRTTRDPKESAALGIFGSESEDEGPGKRWKGKSNLRGKGMAFVSTGQKTMDEDEAGEEDEEEDEDENMDDEEDDVGDVESTAGLRAGLGMGLGASKGLGWSPAPSKETTGVKYGTPLGKGFVPSSAAAPILRDTEDDEISTPRMAMPSAFATPASGKRKGAQGGTTMNAGSFAARMMAKMGYKEGQGLGKEGQGRSGVIEVQLRPQGVGLGAVKEKSKQEKEEEKRQAKLRGEVYEDSEEERKKKKKGKKPGASAKGSGASTPRRAAKPKYRTVAEVERAAPGLKIPEAFAPILDMTGPGQKLLTTTSGLLTPVAGAAPETVEQAESKKLARRAQSDLSAFVEEWKNLQERKAYVNMQIIQAKQEADDQQPDLDKARAFSDTVKDITQAVKDGQRDPVIQALSAVDGYQLSGDNETLSSIAVAAVHPFLRQSTEGWQPLDNPKLDGMAPALFSIRHILGASGKSPATSDMLNGSRRAKSTTPYESMIYKIIFPKIVSAINQGWDVHNPTSLLALLDAWEGLLPAFVRSQILDQAVIGKLNEAVSAWNPKKRRSHELPHLWLFPWLQYLPAHHADPKSSTGLVSDVKRKFRQLVDSWDYHKGVVPGLQQWREVLCPTPSNDHWRPLIMNHVLPSMARFLSNDKNFLVDPNDQTPYMSALQGVFGWQEILGPRIIGQVIVEAVFPKWHSVLHQWLTVVGPNEEIGRWFEWWRDAVFPAEVQAQKAIQDEFERGHEMINTALDLGAKAATLLPAPVPPSHDANERAKSPPRAAPAQLSPAEEIVTVRQQVDEWCVENDLQMLPEKRTLHAAGPLYRITAAGNGKNGTLVCFQGERLLALQRRGPEMLEIPIAWEDADARDALLEMAWHNVK